MIDKVISNDAEANPYLGKTVSLNQVSSSAFLQDVLSVLKELGVGQRTVQLILNQGNNWMKLVKFIESEGLPLGMLDSEDFQEYLEDDLLYVMDELSPTGYYFGEKESGDSNYGYWQV